MVLNSTINTGNIIVERISPWSLVGWFVAYLILHIAIGYIFKQKEAELAKRTDTDTTEYKDLTQQVKMLKLGFKWFPAAYLVFVILALAL